MNYPDWVKKFRTKGTAVKKVGNSYYLYKHSSKRVPGKKYPQAVDTYIGVITPDGVVRKNKKKVSLENIEVFEYGFSKALYDLCTLKWKNDLKEDWRDVLYLIIKEYSPNSYLLRDHEFKKTSIRLSLQTKKLEDEIGVPLNELMELNTIYLLCFQDREAISKINDKHKSIIDKYHINIGGEEG